MDLEHNAKLQAIMDKHNTDVWNEDCNNDPDYIALTGGERVVPGTIDKKTITQPTNLTSRRERRAMPEKPQPTNVVGKAHRNNRPMNKARKNNKLFLKLAEFEMSVGAKRHS